MELLVHWKAWLWSSAILVGSVILALPIRFLVFVVLKRIARHNETVLDSVFRRTEKASWWIFPLLGFLIALPGVFLPPNIVTPIQHAVGLGLIATTGWLVIMVSKVTCDLIASRYQINAADNLLARKVQTEFQQLHRIVVVVVMIVALAVMLMTFPAIRSIGTNLLASAGLAGLIVGMAMRPTLASLVAGIQIALTQPIRIEDSVVVEGEWGWIEEIGATYVREKLIQYLQQRYPESLPRFRTDVRTLPSERKVLNDCMVHVPNI